MEPWASDYDLKAAFVYSIVSFIEWPPGVLSDRIVVGFAGEGPMANAMGKLFVGKRVGSRPIEVREAHTRNEMRACNVLLLAYPDRSRMKEALMQVRGTMVLTVGDGEPFTKYGGIITFVPHNNTFRLAINPQAAERSHLKISSKLMSIATVVSDDESATRE